MDCYGGKYDADRSDFCRSDLGVTAGLRAAPRLTSRKPTPLLTAAPPLSTADPPCQLRREARRHVDRGGRLSTWGRGC